MSSHQARPWPYTPSTKIGSPRFGGTKIDAQETLRSKYLSSPCSSLYNFSWLLSDTTAESASPNILSTFNYSGDNVFGDKYLQLPLYGVLPRMAKETKYWSMHSVGSNFGRVGLGLSLSLLVGDQYVETRFRNVVLAPCSCWS